MPEYLHGRHIGHIGARRHALRDDRAEREVAGRAAAADREASDRAARTEDTERDASLPPTCDSALEGAASVDPGWSRQESASTTRPRTEQRRDGEECGST